MKTLYASVFVLFMTLTFSVNTISAQEKENKMVATFKEVTDNEYFKFVDDKNVAFLFYDMDDSVNFPLYEIENIGKKFTLTWVDKVVETIDENGNPTGEKINVKSIMTLEEEK